MCKDINSKRKLGTKSVFIFAIAKAILTLDQNLNLNGKWQQE